MEIELQQAEHNRTSTTSRKDIASHKHDLVWEIQAAKETLINDMERTTTNPSHTQNTTFGTSTSRTTHYTIHGVNNLYTNT